MIHRLLTLSSYLLFAACASSPSPGQVQGLLADAYAAAEAHARAGRDHEAALLLTSVHEIDPELEGLDALRAEVDPNAFASMESGWLGSNRKLRPRADRSIVARVALYLPDRLLDLLDVVSVDAHMGYGFFVDAHVTRAVQAAGGFRSVAGLGLHEHRSLGGRAQIEAGLNVLPVGAQTFTGGLAGTSGALGIADHFAGLHRPDSRLYREYRDYWSVGAAGTVLFVGVDGDLHLAQLADFLLGFAGIDLLNDDFARTRGLGLSRSERLISANLSRVRGDPRAVEGYLARVEAARTENDDALADSMPAPTTTPRATPAPLAGPTPPASPAP